MLELKHIKKIYNPGTISETLLFEDFNLTEMCIRDSNYIEETIGLARLPEQLAEVARVRLEYPDRSLKELGSFLMTPVGKSGVNHRLRKISSIAEALREGKGGIE